MSAVKASVDFGLVLAEDYNRFISENGVFGDDVRLF